MAQLVFGMGMSHSPLVTVPDSWWAEWAAQDAALAILYDGEGQLVLQRDFVVSYWEENFSEVCLHGPSRGCHPGADQPA